MSDERKTAVQQMMNEHQRHAEAGGFAAMVMQALRDYIPDRCQREAYDELRQAFLRSDSVTVHRLELEELRKFRERMLLNAPMPSILTTADAVDALKDKRTGG